MKKVHLIMLFLLILIKSSCQTENKYPTDNIVPKNAIIQSFPINNKVQFSGFSFPQILKDSIESSESHLKMSSDSASILIIRYDENDLIKRLLGDNPGMKQLFKKHNIYKGYELLKKIYYITPESQIEDKNQLLELKSILMPLGSEEMFIEYQTPIGNCFQSGSGGNGQVILNWFVGDSEFMIVMKHVSMKQIRQFLGGVSKDPGAVNG
ncbi:hypothetical protein [Fluviicola sp.]|uniref:hypothetical protein n=1 Tax=Fluviicola sp. TaxID=1917219 RepID=UPI002607C263|nr:hypothetical protein [Fluviicola sp.]